MIVIEWPRWQDLNSFSFFVIHFLMFLGGDEGVFNTILNVVNTNICSNKGCQLRSFNKLKLQTKKGVRLLLIG
jgi:hypothetical protein